jgi:hypothetical protein
MHLPLLNRQVQGNADLVNRLQTLANKDRVEGAVFLVGRPLLAGLPFAVEHQVRRRRHPSSSASTRLDGRHADDDSPVAKIKYMFEQNLPPTYPGRNKAKRWNSGPPLRDGRSIVVRCQYYRHLSSHDVALTTIRVRRVGQNVQTSAATC